MENFYPMASENMFNKYPVASEPVHKIEESPVRVTSEDFSGVVLKRGQQNHYVKRLQELLNKKNYDLKVDGFFGSKTESRLRAFQNDCGLTIDGIAGEKTFNELLK